MFLPRTTLCVQRRRFPRIRGDVPGKADRIADAEKFSPHTRGCSVREIVEGAMSSVSPHTRGCSVAYFYGIHPGRVFPAYAGMFRLSRVSLLLSASFPRIRGDVPRTPEHPAPQRPFSPHTRGCSASGRHVSPFDLVFPAYAGMFRSRVNATSP